MVTLKLPYEVLVTHRVMTPANDHSNVVPGLRVKRELAQFHDLESYHWRISLGDKWGIGLFPWYGVVFLADHIDNLTNRCQGDVNFPDGHPPKGIIKSTTTTTTTTILCRASPTKL